MRKIYIFTGKGGVGKSSVAAAHAMKSAGEGKATLLVSTDMAHNLGDIFERKLGREIEKQVMPNLDLYDGVSRKAVFGAWDGRYAGIWGPAGHGGAVFLVKNCGYL